MIRSAEFRAWNQIGINCFQPEQVQIHNRRPMAIEEPLCFVSRDFCQSNRGRSQPNGLGDHRTVGLGDICPELLTFRGLKQLSFW
jgi:hypothetical protein